MTVTTHRSSKPYQFKAPPQLTALFPLLLSYSIELRTARTIKSPALKKLHIDMSLVEEIDVVGCTIFATNLAKAVAQYSEFEFQIKPPLNEEVAQFLIEIKFAELLARLGLHTSPTPDLWNQSASAPQSEVTTSECRARHERIIFVPKIHQDQREDTLQKIRDSLQDFYTANESEHINFGQVHQILHEIIKNTIDHSGEAGVLAMKLAKDANGEQFSFAHCEMGDGISRQVRTFLATSDFSELKRLADRGSTADFLHWAFLPGHSSKPAGGVNAGLGLSQIQAAAKGGKIRVYFSDARSLAYVTDFPDVYSHKQLRKRLHHSQSIPSFMYFGETLKYKTEHAKSN